MLKIGNMIWRIGRLLDVGRQMAWTRRAGFDGVGLHASAGAPGQWRGLDPAACEAQERAHWRQRLSEFAFAEIHAPFAIELRTENLDSCLSALEPVLCFARDLGAGVVTVHAQTRDAESAAWLEAMGQLDAQAARAGTVVALEIVEGFEAVAAWDLPHVGVNLDVGHMYLPANLHLLSRFGGLGKLIRLVGPKLVHLHLHDVAGGVDHAEIGTGEVAFDEIIGALAEINYGHAATIEMNPDRVPPVGMRRSLRYLRTRLSGRSA